MTVYNLGASTSLPPPGYYQCSKCQDVGLMSDMQIVSFKAYFGEDHSQIQLWSCKKHVEEVRYMAEEWVSVMRHRYELEQEKKRTEAFIKRLLG